MNFLCLLLLLGLYNTFATLTAPELDLEQSNSKWKLVWKPVQSSDENDPVLGYRVKVNVYVINDRDHIVDDPSQPLSEQELLLKSNETELEVNLEPRVPYQFWVQAFAKSGDGPLSDPKSVPISEDFDE